MAGNSPGGYTINYTIAVSDKYTQPLGNFSKSLEGVEKKAEEVSKKIDKHFSFKNLGDKFTSIGSKLSLGITAPLSILALGAIKAAGDFEFLQSSLTNFTGSAELSSKVIHQLDNLFDRSVFSLSQYVEASKKLVGAGTRVEDVAKKVKGLADVGAKFGIPVETLAEAVVKSKQMGFSLRHVQLLAGQGIPVFKELGKYVKNVTGQKFSEAQLKKFVSQGRVSGKAFEGILEQMAAKGGIAFEGMKTATDNYNGALLGLKEESHKFLIDFGTSLRESLGLTDKLKFVTDKIKELRASFSIWSKENPETTKNIFILGGALMTIGPILASIGIGFKILNLLMLTNPLVLTITAISAAIAVLIANWDKLKEGFLSFKTAPVVGGLVGKLFGKGEGVSEGVIKEYTPIVKRQNEVSAKNATINGTIGINVNDPGKVIKSVSSHTDGLAGFNLGVNTSAMAY